MTELKNLDKLPPDIQPTVAWYSRSMLRLHRENLRSIIVYGSAAGLDFLPGKSNINLMLILNRIPFDVLRNSLKLIAAGRKKRILAPLFLTEEHILSSCDTFPIEFLEIKEKHLTIFGEDIFQKLTIEQANLRLQCEQEIKGKIIRLRQSYLETGLRKKHLEHLLVNSLTALLPAFRSIIRLQGGSPPQSRENIIREIAAGFHLQAEVFIEIVRLKEGKAGHSKSELEEIMDAYLGALHELAKKIDGLSVSS